MFSSKTMTENREEGPFFEKTKRKRRNAVSSITYYGTRPPPSKLMGRSYSSLTKNYTMAAKKYKENKEDMRTRVLLIAHMNFVRNLVMSKN